MRISFYILNKTAIEECLIFACKLLEKAFAQKFDITIKTATSKLTQRFDKILWHYSDTSFIPHEIDSTDPLQISIYQSQSTKNRILLDLSLQKVSEANSWQRVLYLVPNDENSKKQAEALHQIYQKQGFQLETFPIKV